MQSWRRLRQNSGRLSQNRKCCRCRSRKRAVCRAIDDAPAHWYWGDDDMCRGYVVYAARCNDYI
eukprot:14647082-Ditylum_brightwellii.AAC.1